MDSGELVILLAEDDDGHASLIRRNIERAGLGAELRRMRDGGELIASLDRDLSGSLAKRPVLVLLDISMPGIGGIETLARIRSNPKTKSVPVYMLTTTDNPVEVSRCFEAGCNAYLTKPVLYEEFTSTMQRLCAFLGVSEFPPASLHPTHRRT